MHFFVTQLCDVYTSAAFVAMWFNLGIRGFRKIYMHLPNVTLIPLLSQCCVSVSPSYTDDELHFKNHKRFPFIFMCMNADGGYNVIQGFASQIQVIHCYCPENTGETWTQSLSFCFFFYLTKTYSCPHSCVYQLAMKVSDQSEF